MINPRLLQFKLSAKRNESTDLSPQVESSDLQTRSVSTPVTETDTLYTNIFTLKEELQVPKDPEEELGSPDQFSAQMTSKIVKSYAERNQVDENTALVAIARLVQDGGTNSSKPNLKRSIKGKVYDLQDLREVVQLISKTGTVRKLAKTLRNVIAHIARINGWIGPLFKDLKRAEPTLPINSDEAIFCNEIHSDNYAPGVPPQIREALQRRESRLRDQRLQIPVKGKKKTNKRKK